MRGWLLILELNEGGAHFKFLIHVFTAHIFYLKSCFMHLKCKNISQLSWFLLQLLNKIPIVSFDYI